MFDPPALAVRLARLQYSRRRPSRSFAWMNFAFKRVLLLMLVHASLALSAFATCTAPKNPIEAENCQQGTPSSQWYINGAGSSNIVGFTTDISVNVGQTVTFKISTNALSWRIDIYRLGYYQGNGARFITSVSPSVSLPQIQPACLSDSSTGLVDCGNWLPSASWTVPSTATSGIYFARLIRLDTGEASPAIFVVRNDSSHSDILVQTSDETWHAYNVYGGNSLYTGNTGNPGGRAYKVSYNRPFQVTNGNTWLFTSEIPMHRWLEANGYDLSYSADVDTDRNGSLITQHKIFISVAHDEYWSGGQRASVEAARAAGVNLGFFSGNAVFWKTRWEPSIDGTNTPYRTLVCYKERTFDSTVIDPQDPPTWTGIWQDGRFSPPADGGRPENALTGTKTGVSAPPNPPSYPINVPQADGRMRFWRNTSMATLGPGQVGTLPTGVLGYEWEEDSDNGFRPAGLIRLSTTTEAVSDYLVFNPSPPPGSYGFFSATVTHHLTMYRAPSGALVFGAGTIQWSWGLDATHDLSGTPTDVNMQQATVNILADMSAQPATLQSGLVPAVASTDTTPPVSAITSPSSGSTVAPGSSVTISGTATDSGGGVVGGVEISVDGGTTWHPAVGRENWSYTTTFNNNATVNIRSRAVDDSGNLEVPGPGITITVGTPAPPPSVGSVNPNSGAQGQSLSSVIITGSNFQSGATCSFGAGITVNSCTFNSATQLTANISIGSTAATGTRNVSVTNPDSQTGTLTNGFTVTTGAPPPPPTVSSVNPNSGAQGQSLPSVIITGSNFQSGATCNLGAGITVNSCTFNSVTQLTANITISSTATLGTRNVTVTNPDNQTSTLTNGFSVTTPPAISLIQKATFSRQPTSGGTATLTLPQATGAGHTLIVGMSFWPLDISSVTDGSGDAFTRGLTTSIYHNVNGSATYTNFYYAKSTAGGTTSLTLNFSGGSTYLLIAVAEVAGLDPSAPLDQSGYHDSLTATTAWSSAAVTTTAANEYLFSWASSEASNATCANPASGWVIESQTNPATVCLLDRVVSATGPYQASVTASTAQNYAMELATFKGSAPSGPPPTPTGLTAIAGNSQVSLTWNTSAGAASYNLYRSVNGGAYSQLNTSPITTTSYTDSGLTNGTPCCYEATAVNSSGESAKSSPACATPQPPPPPPTPTGLTATAGNAQVSLAWNASTGAASYNLYRSVNGGAYSQLNTSPITTTSYTDSGLTNGTPYCYEATAVNSSGESAKASPACATPQPPPPPPAISLIQKATFSQEPTSSGTETLTLPHATGAGHTLIVGMSFWPLDISSVTDGSADTFTRGLTTSIYHNVNGSATYNNFFYAKSTAGGTTSLTLNFSGGSTYLLVAVAEVAGLNPSAPLDQSGYHESLTATTAWSSAAVTTTATNEYLFAWAATQAGNPPCSSPASGWTIESQTNDPSGSTVCLLDRVVPATGSYQASVTASTAQNYAMEIVTFK